MKERFKRARFRWLASGLFFLVVALFFLLKKTGGVVPSLGSTRESTRERDIQKGSSAEKLRSKSRAGRETAQSIEERVERLVKLPPGGVAVYQIPVQSIEKLGLELEKVNDYSVFVFKQELLIKEFGSLLKKGETIPMQWGYFSRDETHHQKNYQEIEAYLVGNDHISEVVKEKIRRDHLKPSAGTHEFSLEMRQEGKREYKISGSFSELPDDTRRFNTQFELKDTSSSMPEGSQEMSQTSITRVSSNDWFVIVNGQNAFVLNLSQEYQSRYN